MENEKKFKQQKWYFNNWIIAILFSLWIIYLVPLIIGIILLIFKTKSEKKEIERVDDLLADYDRYFNEYDLNNLDKVEQTRKSLIKQVQDLEKNKENKLTELKETENKLLEAKIILGDYEKDLKTAEFGIYKPIFDFNTPEEYKNNIDTIIEKQKTMISIDKACNAPKTFTLDGSLSKGKKFINDSKKQLIRSFNGESDAIISKVRYNNFSSIKTRIINSYKQLNKLNEKIQIEISPEYLDLKISELHAYLEYEQKKQDDKEKAKEERERLKEEAKLIKELNEKRKVVEKEKNHYTNALNSLLEQLKNEPNNQVLLDKKKELEEQIDIIEDNLKDIDYREANKRAGYVYVISNIGSFGENVYKIGMTRRLDPLERVNELGDASVPFNFDVHAMIFSDDAPALENALHHAFEDKKVNMVNPRREFFKVTLEEIEEVVKNNYDKTVDFIKIAEAEQYRASKNLYKD